MVEQLGCAALTYSVRVSDGGTDYFHGFEHFGLITLVNQVFRVHSMRFFLRACGVSAALLPSVPYFGGGIIYLCMLIVRLRSVCRVGAAASFARFMTSSVAWRCGPAFVD